MLARKALPRGIRCIVLRGVEPLDAELASFVDSVRNGTRPLVDGQVGLEALEVALAVKAEILERLAR